MSKWHENRQASQQLKAEIMQELALIREPVTAKDLANILDVEPARISNALNSLYWYDYVTRTRNGKGPFASVRVWCYNLPHPTEASDGR